MAQSFQTRLPVGDRTDYEPDAEIIAARAQRAKGARTVGWKRDGAAARPLMLRSRITAMAASTWARDDTRSRDLLGVADGAAAHVGVICDAPHRRRATTVVVVTVRAGPKLP